MFWLVLSVLVGAVVWLTLSGRLTPLLRRAAGWWLDVGANQRASAPPHPASDPVEDEDDSPGLLQRFTARLRARFSRYDDIDDGMVADTRPAPAAHIPPAAPAVPLSASPPVLPATPRVAERASAVPVIELRDVADNLQQRHYRQSREQPCASTPAEPAAELPLLDGKAIRDNMLGRVRHVPAKPVEPILPVIGPNEVEQNLQQLGSRLRERAPSVPSHDEPLPVIDAGAVRESLRQIHGARFRPRPETPRVQEPEPRPAPPRFVSPPAVPAPAPQPQPSSPLLRRREEGDAPARFVDLPAAVAHRADGVPVESVRAPEPPVRAPRPVVTPVQVMPTIVRPAVRIAQVPAEPVLPPVVQVESTVKPLPEDEPAPAAPSSPQPAVAEPAGLSGTVVPAPRAPTSAGIVWHSIEERAPAVTPPVSAPVPVAADEDVRPTSLVVEVPPSPSVPTPGPSRHLWDDSSLPSLALLRPADPLREVCSEEALLERGIVIEEKLAEFKVKVSVVDAYAGPVITRFEIEPAVGVRGSQVVNLVKDLARALGLASIRVVETIPGKTCMGLELPNPVRQMIRLSEILSAPVFTDSGARLTLALGKDITGEPVVMDLTKAPHLLVAGTTGSGKSVGVNAMILSLLYRFTPDKVRFIMIDPKMLELSVYNDIPHLLAPVVTDMKLAANALNWCVGEMEKRYRLMSALGVRNLAGYNEKVREAEVAGEKLTNPFTVTPDNPEPLETLPSIVVVVDEFADLMMVAGKKIEELIARLAQKARAAGIHLILATQRPSVDVITGLIKANIPTRIAFQVSSKVDSRTILDQMGAEALLGQGDMLFLPPGSGYPQRIHGAFVTDDEVHAIVETLKSFGEPDYIDGLLTGESELEESAATERSAGAESDPLYDEAVEIVLRTRKASISSVQRHLRIGYNRAARLIEEMEAAGLVSSMENNGNRTVLVPPRAE